MDKENEEGKGEVVIATLEVDKALYIIAKAAATSDIIELTFTSKYEMVVDYLVRILRKAFGWIEIERGTKEVRNTRCVHNVNGECTNKKISGKIKCSEAVRLGCDEYSQKYTNTLTVNTVIIEKAGSIRGL